MTSTSNGARAGYGAQVLILLGMYLFGGGGGDDSMTLTERVQEVVQDDARRSIAGDYARQIQEILARTSNDSLQVRGKIIAEINQYPRDPVALRAEIARALDETLAAEQQIVELRFKLKEQMTRGEWTRLFNELRANR